MNTKTHYIAMNGSIGCLPDHTEIYDTLEDAVEGLVSLFEPFDDLSPELDEDFAEILKDQRIFYFPDGFGADYCEIVEEPCIGINAGCEYHDNEW